MIRGERSINLNSFVNLYPFTLYTRPNFKGRALKVDLTIKKKMSYHL